MNRINKADEIFLRNIKDILDNGVMSQQARPKYKDGKTANSKYVTQICDTYDINKGEFPITTLRPIPIKSAIKEISWIYQKQSNKLMDLQDMGVNYWNEWDIGDGTIGKRYGYVVKKHKIIDNLLKGLEKNPFNRRNVISLWDYECFDETDGLLPCAYNVMFDVRVINGECYLDCTLTQRSNDMLVAHHINAMQYVALQMMIACHFGWSVGKFAYFINNLHIYDNQFNQARELLERGIKAKKTDVKLVLNEKPKTNFYDIDINNFELVNYDPIKPQLKFDLAI